MRASNHLVGFGSFKEDIFVRLVTISANISKQDLLNFFKVREEFIETHPILMLKKYVTLNCLIKISVKN